MSSGMAAVCLIYKNKEQVRSLVFIEESIITSGGEIVSSILHGSFSDWLMNNKVLSRSQAGPLRKRGTAHNYFVVKLQ
jgi:hypothetical protein